MKKILLMFVALLSFTGMAMAQKALPYEYGFENNDLDAEGWTKTITTSLSNNNKECGINAAAKKTGNYGFRFSSYRTRGENAQYLISPELDAPNGIIVSFAWKVSNGQYSENFKVGYSTTDTDVASFTWDDGTTSSNTGWSTIERTFPAGTKYVAIYYYSNYCAYLYVDDFSFTAPLSGPALTVTDYDTKQTLTSPASYNFGLATPGTIHYFLLTNPGTEDLGVTLSKTGDFGATLSTTTVPAGGNSHVALTVTMPDATGSSEITITPDATSGIDPFVINVSGTAADPNKLLVNDFSALPEDWTTTGSWYYSSTNGAYTTSWYLTSEARLITPLLTVSDGETFYVEAKGYSTSNTTYQHLQMQYSADGTTWTNFDSEPALDPSNWQTFAFTGVPAGKYYIAINASQADIRMFYGGETAKVAKMVVTQPSSLHFGVITETTTKTFTIANTGKATLEGISVTSSNSSIFAVTNAPTSLAAGASAEVTITMSATTVGNLSSDITVSATDMENVQFTISGTVLPIGLSVIDFNDNVLPARWENTGWTFNNGAAYAAYHSPAYVMTTPKIVVNDGDMLVIKGKIEYNSSFYYVTVKGLNSSSAEVYSKKLTNDVFNNTDFTAVLLSDIPATVEYLQFVGYYGYIDEIQGINYAAALSVTTGNPAVAVSTPANYDFGEAATDATVTYNFANTGAGTIDITNVAITGDGAAAYSTNWTTSVATPFDLTITRTYDATRTGAQNAVVTVTTTDGDFIINVTGTDKAANAPELAVTPAENAAFGVVATATEKTYTVTNAGTGLLTVNIASDDAKFTVSPAKLEDIAAGGSKTFTVTFTPEANTYGMFNANITVTPTYDETAVVTIAASAKVKDPNVWSEDFATNAVPTGWDAGSNWTFTGGVAKAAYQYGTTSYLTTPTLTVSDATEELTFDYKATANYVSIKIQMSKDGGAFADYQTISSLNNGDAGTFTITGLESGEYQFRFANDDYELDNFEGFKLNLADHIMVITASSIPASASYSPSMKATQPFNATVTVKENRGVNEENVVAKLYMGQEVIGTSEATTVEAGETKVITITATPTVAATEGAEMHIEVEWAGTTLTTEIETRYVAEFKTLALTETEEKDIETGYSAVYDQVTLTRSFVAGWNTFVAPQAVALSEFGDGAKAYTYTGYDADAETLNFTSASELNPATPYIIYIPEAINNKVFTWNSPVIYSSFVGADNIRTTETTGTWTFQGTYAPIAAGNLTGNYGVTSAGRIQKAATSASIKGFRAYFVPNEEWVKEHSISIKGLVFNDDATGLRTISVDSEEAKAIFDLNGRQLNKAQRGINIVNGKKVMIK